MAIFYVTYDLMKQKDYQKLWDRLEQYRAKRVLLSVWALRGEYRAVDLRDDLLRYVDNDDRVLVIESSTSAWSAHLLAALSASWDVDGRSRD